MENLTHKLRVLSTVAACFNREHITWAVGASLLLYLKGKTDTFHDIDLLVLESDVEKVRAIIAGLGVIEPPNPDARYRTRHFIECRVQDVELDIMAGFTIVRGGVEYDCSLKREEITDSVLINNQSIPLHSLALWKRYYQLMGRAEKAAMI